MSLTGRLLDYEDAIDVADEALRQHIGAVLVDSLTDVVAPELIEIRSASDGRYDMDVAGVLLVGPSGSGKTTASVGAALRGFGYVTDDIVAAGAAGVIR